MSDAYPLVPLGDVLIPISRPERVDPEKTFHILGAHWYADGLYTKDIKTGATIQADKVYRVEQGDFVYNRLFAWKGSFAIATAENDGCYVSNEFPCFTVKPDRGVGQYLWRYFSRESAWDEAFGLSTGGTPTSRNRLKEDKLLAMRIPLPSLTEQRRIVARIEELAAKIAEARGLRRQAVEEASTFVTSLHLNLAGERNAKIANFLTLDECKEDIQLDGLYPQVGVRGFGQGLFAKGAVRGSETTYKVFNRLYEGALVLSQVKGWEGAIGICRAHLADKYVSPEYRTFRCNPSEAIPKYLDSLVATPWFWKRLSTLTRGVGARRERIRPEMFLQMEIPMPTVSQQDYALHVLRGIEHLRRLQAETAAELDALLPSVLDRAFRGEL